MPNISRLEEVYLGAYTPDTFNVASLYMPGQLGVIFVWNNNTYMVVQLESGATTPAANQLLYWKSKSAFTVTNVFANALGATAASAANNVAGVLRNAATAGNYICVLIRGQNINVLSSATTGTPNAGDVAIADVGTVTKITQVAAGTAPTYIPVGVCRGAVSSGSVAVDVNVPVLY